LSELQAGLARGPEFRLAMLARRG
ncbi:hypothetical protein A2U01_0072296, partial [Trifolium medium]|nr:hypothetical protein [Trifolium medium]